MEETRTFAPLLLVVFLAFIVPLVLSRFRKLRLPIVVGEILAGIIVGRSGFGWVEHHDPVLGLLSDFGFVFLMFLSGIEIDFSSFRLSRSMKTEGKAMVWKPVPLGVINFGMTLLLSLIIGFALFRYDLVRNPWIMALILSTTSLGVVMPVLKERGLSRGLFGQTLLISALIADFATMLLITVVVAILSTGLTFDILLIGILFLAFFLIYHFGTLFFNHIPGVRRALEELNQASAQIKVRAAFTMMLIFVVLSEVLGTELILGAFLAGAIVALLRTPEDDDLALKLEAIGFGFFIPIFFIMVGVDFNLTALFSSPQALLLVPLLLLAAVVVKVFPSLIFRLRFGWVETLAAGSLLTARLSLIIAASAIGLQMGVISDTVNAAIILVAVITVTGAPLVFLRLGQEVSMKERPPTIVAGAGDLGLRVAEHLQAHHEPVVLIDPDQVRVSRAQKRGFKAIFADLTKLEDLNPQAGELMEGSRALVCTHEEVEFNYRVCETAHIIYGIDEVVAGVNEPGQVARFRRLGANPVNIAMDQAAIMAILARNPGVYSLLTHADEDKEVGEVLVRAPYCQDKRLHQMELPGDVLVVALRRKGDLLIPHGDTLLECGDRLTLIGSIEAIDTARHLFGELGVV
jgi:CPA2 family monovalent cation:H+ antiporter-2